MVLIIRYGAGSNVNSHIQGLIFRNLGNRFKMVLTNSGRLGINTSLPENTLHVRENGFGRSPLRLDGSGITSGATIINTSVTGDNNLSQMIYHNYDGTSRNIAFKQILTDGIHTSPNEFIQLHNRAGSFSWRSNGAKRCL